MSSSCPRTERCPLFRAFSIKSSMKVWRTYYCDNDFERCERWRLAQSGKQVPANLLPSGRTLLVPPDPFDEESESTG